MVTKRMEGNPFWKVVVWVVVFEAMERLTYYCIGGNATHYIRGFMGEGTASTSALTSAFRFIGYGSSLGWGIVADTVFGRKLTLLSIGIAYAVCVILMSVSTIPQLTQHVDMAAGEEPIMAGKAIFFLSYFGVAMCMGGIKANVASIGADQFDESIPSHVHWRRIFFTWFYIMIQAGGIIGGFFSSPMQAPDPSTIGYTVGFGFSAAAMVFAVIVFACIYKKLYSPAPEALDIGKTMKAFFTAIGQKIVCRPVPVAGEGFGDRAAAQAMSEATSSLDVEKGVPVTGSPSSSVSKLYSDPANWMMARVGPKYGAKGAADAFQISRVVPLWLSLMTTAVVYDVSQGVAVLQGQQMRAPSIAYNASFQQSIMDPVICLIFMTLILYVVHPLSKKWGWELTPERRIVLSTVSASIGCAIGGILEIARKNAPILTDAAGNEVMNSDGVPVHDISLLWQILFFTFTSLMQALAWPAGVEFFYTQMPDDFKSIGQGIFQFCLGVASAVNMCIELIGHGLNWLPDDLDTGYLENYYFAIMVIGVLGTLGGVFSIYLYKRSGGDYADKCGVLIDDSTAEPVLTKKEKMTKSSSFREDDDDVDSVIKY